MGIARLRLVTTLGLLVALVGCETLFEVGRKQYTFEVIVDEQPLETLTLALGASQALTARISPVTGVDLTTDPATVSLMRAPEGVSIDPSPLRLPSGIDSGTLTLSVATDAPLVSDATVEFQSEKGGVGRRFSFLLGITAAE